ncbi:MAG TPA: hypothetical protein VMR06_06825 [Dokdonella sp.]|uniref:hypothetical protein n=1 Tax=Dokdonella sp. TaxID=2291710 RepID=UPI002C43F70E|nr:hypothetical protein [Dokdonella sp.]HUD41699.1 hypothetical protein [Dokdonella sp.]
MLSVARTLIALDQPWSLPSTVALSLAATAWFWRAQATWLRARRRAWGAAWAQSAAYRPSAPPSTPASVA